MKFCYRCGAKIQPGSRFCVECGTPLVESAAEKQPAPAAAPVAPAPAPVPEVQPELVPEDQKTVVYAKPVSEEKPEPMPVSEEPETVIAPETTPAEEPVQEEKNIDPDATVYVAPADPDATVFVAEPEAAPAEEPVRSVPHADPDATVFVAEDVPAAAPQPVPVQQRPVQPPFPQQNAAPQRPPFPQTPVSQKPTDAQKAVAAKTKSAKSKKYGPLGGGRKFLAVLLCILIFFLSSAAVTMLSARLAIRPESIADTMQGLVSSLDLGELEAREFFPEAEEGLSVSDWVAEQIEIYYSGYIKVDGSDVESYLEKSVLLHSMGEIIGNFVEDLLTGSHHDVPDLDEIRDILMEDQKLVEELFGFAMDEEDIETLAQAIVDSGALQDLDASEVRSEAPVAFDVIELSFSYWVIGGLCALVLVLCVLVGLVNRGNMIRTFRDLGVTETVLGALMTVSVLACYLLTDYLVSMAGIDALGDIVRFALLKGAMPAVVVLGAGIVMLVISGIVKAVHKRAVAKEVKAA